MRKQQARLAAKQARLALQAKRGFTLIELLVVIAIIGLLSTLAVVSLNGARSKARDARRVSDLNATRSALEVYRDDHFDKVVALGANWGATIGTNLNVDATYLPGGAPTEPDSTRTGNSTYVYCVDDNAEFYLLHAVLENTPPGRGLDGDIASYQLADCVNADGVLQNFTGVTCDGDVQFCLGKL